MMQEKHHSDTSSEMFEEMKIVKQKFRQSNTWNVWNSVFLKATFCPPS